MFFHRINDNKLHHRVWQLEVQASGLEPQLFLQHTMQPTVGLQSSAAGKIITCFIELC